MQVNRKLSLFVVIAVALLGLGFLLGQSFRLKDIDEHEAIYATVDGKPIYGKEVWLRMSPELDRLEREAYRIKRRAVEDLILERYGAGASGPSTTGGKPPATYDQIEVSNDEINAQIRARKLVPQKVSKEQIANIKANLQMQKFAESRKLTKQGILERHDIRWRIPLPYLARTKFTPPRQGLKLSKSKTGSVDLVWLTDVMSPTNAESFRKLKTLQEKYQDDLNVFVLFYSQEPDDLTALRALTGADCAKDHQLSWEYMQWAATSPPRNPSDFTALAQNLNLDPAALERCISDSKRLSKVKARLTDISSLKASELPGFVINEHLLGARTPLEEVMLFIDSQFD